MSTTQTIDQTLQTAAELHRQGQLGQADTLYRQVLQQEPDHPTALHLAGLLALKQGQPQVALQMIGRAAQLQPAVPEFQFSLGRVLRITGRLDAAIAAFRRAAQLDPSVPTIFTHLSAALADQGALAESVVAQRRAVELQPTADGYCRMARILMRTGTANDAATWAERALRLDPTSADAGVALADIRIMQGRPDQAIALYRNALQQQPRVATTHNNLGLALHRLGRFDEAAGAYRQALNLEPTYADAQVNLGLTLLLQGQWKAGWEHYEWRWRSTGFSDPPRTFPNRPVWTGQDLAGQSILIYAEQSFGDTIQFARFLPMVAARGGHVVFECQTELKRLMQGLPGAALVVARGQRRQAFQTHLPLLSLPHVLGITPDNIPAHVPYLDADAQHVQALRRKWAGTTDGTLRVGLAWAGTPQADPQRAIPAQLLAPLGQVHDVTFVSLQIGATTPVPLKLADSPEPVLDFADMAALIGSLDLVISVDAPATHLAGALGKAAWTLLPAVPDSRWLLDRPDTPWYPKMRLIRQTTPGDWAGVVERARRGLLAAVKKRGA